jgi:cyclophilin family peptidyl-prolyl cis-trans isomerase
MKMNIRKLLFLLFTAFALMSMAKDPDARTRVVMDTSMGRIVLELYNETPIHRDNFLKLVRNGFYDGLLFHRVIKDFMIQGGDPDSKDAPKGKVLGEGDLDYRLPPEIRIPDYYHKRGALAMAREGDDVNPERNSSASQFYIVWGKKYSENGLEKVQTMIDKATDGQIKIDSDMAYEYETVGGSPHLDGQYTVFGEVLEGLDVVENIQKVVTDKNDRPLNDVKIIKATVINIKK